MILDDYKTFCCGWGAGLVETFLLYPQNKIIFRQQLHGVVAKEALKQVRREGVWMLYRGVLPPLIQRTTTRAIMFGIYDKLQRAFGCDQCKYAATKTVKVSCAAFLAGSVEALLCPLERTQVLLLTPKYNRRYRNTLHVMMAAANLGPRELYRGFSIVLFRNGWSNVLFFNLREPIRDLFVSSSEKYAENITKRLPRQFLKLLGDFTSGAILGATISTLFFPINVLKQRMQATIGTPFLTSSDALHIVWKERNHSLSGLFRGVHLNYTRSLLSWGITNLTFELLSWLISK